MKTKGPSSKKQTTVKDPVSDLKPDDRLRHYNGILIEHLDSKMQQVVEGMQSTKQELQQEISEFRKETNNHFEIIECAIREHSREIKGVKDEMVGMKPEMRQMEARLSTKIDSIATRVDDHEERIACLEVEQH